MNTINPVSFDSPASYSITVLGKLNSYILDLIGVDEYQFDQTGTRSKTIINILVKDQAQLNGVLNTLYNTRNTVLNIESLEDDQGGR